MKLNRRTDAMRALSDLYRIEAERIESQNILDADANMSADSLRARLNTVQSDREAVDQEIRSIGIRPDRSSGVAQETAWKILSITFAVAGLSGFLAALWSDPPPQVTSTLEPLQLPATHSTPGTPETEAAPVPEPSTASLTPTAPEEKAPRAVTRADKKGRRGGKGVRGKAIRDKAANHADKKPKRPKDDLGFFDDCGMDPMCGFDKKSKKSQ